MNRKQEQEKPLSLLIVEDVEDDALLLADYLQLQGMNCDWHRVDTERAMRDAMQKHWDIVISDYSMPQFSGAHALNVLREYDKDTPFIFVSGTIGEEAAVHAMKAGAQDYVMKGQITRLPVVIERELREVDQRRERRESHNTLQKLSRVVDQTIDSVFITDPKGRIEYINPSFEKLTGYSQDEALGKTPALLRSGSHDSEYYRSLWETLISGNVFRGVMINRRKNGEFFYEEKIISPLKNELGDITHYVSTGRDITARVIAEEERSRLTTILESTPDLVAIMDPDGNMQYLNGAGRNLLGISQDMKIDGIHVVEIFPRNFSRQITDFILPAIKRKGGWSGEVILPLPDGTSMPLSQVVLAHYDNEGDLEFLSAIGRDISERKRFEKELQHHATHDSLTGLPNRYFLIDRFANTLELAKRHGNCVAVLFLDMDNFKRVNDSLGHAAGDELLKSISKRLINCLRPSDTVARHGGDEFTIVVGDLHKVENVMTVLSKIRAEFERSILVEGQEIYVSFSIGVAFYPFDGDRAEELLRHADTAMYNAKSNGANQYQFYTPEMNARGHEFLILEAELRQAVRENEFVLYYQPQLDLRTGRICCAEALIRWMHPLRGLVSPADFIPLLENSRLIMQAGEWVVREACRMHRRCLEAGLQDLCISVNVSGVQFNDPDLVEKVQKILQEESMSPENLELEITENIIMRDPVAAANSLKAFHQLGVRTSIDDFGTGYSSLAYLKQFPLDLLKIDQGFVRDIVSDTNDAVIVETAILMARKLGIEVIAEGVENHEQFELLGKYGCHLIQGYYLSPPMPEELFIDFIRSYHAS